MGKKIILALTGMLWVVYCVGAVATASADDVQRETTALPTAKVLERMLISAEAGQFDKVSKALSLLEPHVEQLNQAFDLRMDEEIKKAIEARSSGNLVAVIQRLIFFSIHTQLANSCLSHVERSELTKRIREAYAEYLVLDYYVRQVDFEASKALKNSFRRLNAVAGLDGLECSRTVHHIESLLLRFWQI